MPRDARKNQRPDKQLTLKFPTGGMSLGQALSVLISADAGASSSIGSRVHSRDTMGADQRGLFSGDMVVEQSTGTGAIFTESWRTIPGV